MPIAFQRAIDIRRIQEQQSRRLLTGGIIAQKQQIVVALIERIVLGRPVAQCKFGKRRGKFVARGKIVRHQTNGMSGLRGIGVRTAHLAASQMIEHGAFAGVRAAGDRHNQKRFLLNLRQKFLEQFAVPGQRMTGRQIEFGSQWLQGADRRCQAGNLARPQSVGQRRIRCS